MKRFTLLFSLAIGCVALAPTSADAAKRYDGTTITVLLNNHPWAPVIKDMQDDFKKETGITLRVEVFNESQFRTRLQTQMSAHSSDLDVFVSLPSREGAIFEKAGWYVDLKPLLANPSLTAKDYDFDDFAPALREGQMIGGMLTGIPINLEGPLLWYRKDIFKKCGLSKPEYLEDLGPIAAKLKVCEPGLAAWSARGKPAMVAYALAGFIFDFGGDFKTADGKPGLCQPKTIEAIQYYGDLIKRYGPVGGANSGFMETVEGLGQGRIAMGFETSNPYARIVAHQGREDDLGIMALPKSKATGISRPVAINWGVSISAYSKHKDAAWAFVQWMTSKQMQLHFFKVAQVAPARVSVFDSPDLAQWASEKPARRDWINALKEISRIGTSVLQSPTVRVPEAREIIGRAAQRVAYGETDAKTAACEANKALEALQ